MLLFDASVTIHFHSGRSVASIADGTQAAMRLSSMSAPLKRGAVTPTTVSGSPFTVTARPMTAGSAPNQVRHAWSLRTITGRAAPTTSSSAVKPRPRANGVRNIVK